MSKIIFTERAWEEYLYWQETDKKTIRRINVLLRDVVRNGNEGIGKPESLKHREGWSRRIDNVHRLVYQLKNDSVEVLQCKGHYDD